MRNENSLSSSSFRHVMLQYFGLFQPSSGIMMTMTMFSENLYEYYSEKDILAASLLILYVDNFVHNRLRSITVTAGSTGGTPPGS